LIAIFTKAARIQRDELLGNIAVGEPGRGEHNPTAALGFEPLSADAARISALRDAIATLSVSARCEFYALMRVGQGDLGAKDLGRGASEAHRLEDETVSAAMVEDADLHDHIMKGLYEAGLSV
jgi:hypothetical protein